MPAPKKKARPAAPLSREAWVKAASILIAQEGVPAVAVEPLAVALGVTKGSFYWHFHNRDELIQAALEAWEQDQSVASLRRWRCPARIRACGPTCAGPQSGGWPSG